MVNYITLGSASASKSTQTPASSSSAKYTQSRKPKKMNVANMTKDKHSIFEEPVLHVFDMFKSVNLHQSIPVPQVNAYAIDVNADIGSGKHINVKTNSTISPDSIMIFRFANVTEFTEHANTVCDTCVVGKDILNIQKVDYNLLQFTTPTTHGQYLDSNYGKDSNICGWLRADNITMEEVESFNSNLNKPMRVLLVAFIPVSYATLTTSISVSPTWLNTAIPIKYCESVRVDNNCNESEMRQRCNRINVPVPENELVVTNIGINLYLSRPKEINFISSVACSFPAYRIGKVDEFFSHDIRDGPLRRNREKLYAFLSSLEGTSINF
jgi:hypothetical protein